MLCSLWYIKTCGGPVEFLVSSLRSHEIYLFICAWNPLLTSKWRHCIDFWQWNQIAVLGYIIIYGINISLLRILSARTQCIWMTAETLKGKSMQTESNMCMKVRFCSLLALNYWLVAHELLDNSVWRIYSCFPLSCWHCTVEMWKKILFHWIASRIMHLHFQQNDIVCAVNLTLFCDWNKWHCRNSFSLRLYTV